MESLRGWVVLTFPRPAASGGALRGRARLVRALGARAPFVAHPWPVTPYHDDYVRSTTSSSAPASARRSRATVRAAATALASALTDVGVPVRADRRVVEEVTLAVAARWRRDGLAGWHGPPWLKEGWFQAWLLQAPALAPARRRTAEETFAAAPRRRCRAAERINLERQLVAPGDGGLRARGARLHGAA